LALPRGLLLLVSADLAQASCEQDAASGARRAEIR